MSEFHDLYGRITASVPMLARGMVRSVFDGMNDAERARIATHWPVMREALARGGDIGYNAFLRAAEHMGIGLFARRLWDWFGGD